MLFGGGEFLMELVDTISVSSFDSAWVDFCKYYSKLLLLIRGSPTNLKPTDATAAE